jgi:hypothetical protein
MTRMVAAEDTVDDRWRPAVAMLDTCLVECWRYRSHNQSCTNFDRVTVLSSCFSQPLLT